MKTETIPHDLWQRHEMEWQAIRDRPANDTAFTPRVVCQRAEDRAEDEKHARDR